MSAAPPGQREDVPLLQIRDLSVTFASPHGSVSAVSGVSLDIAQGELVGLAGESGSGKSVLARSAMGLVRSGRRVEVTGSVRLNGTELVELDDKQLSDLWGPTMAMVFQDPMTSLNPVKRIGAQVAESLHRHRSMGRRAAQDEVVRLLTAVGLPDPKQRARQYPHELSGGSRQRVMIAIALSCSPSMLFADEPTTALDVTVQARVLDLLQDLQARRQMAMLLVSHDLRVLRGRADRLVVMYAGEVVESAPTRDLFTAPLMPYSELLMGAAPPLDGPNHVKLRVIPGRPPDLVDVPAGCRFSPRCPYAQDRCFEEHPPLAPAATGDHMFRCWYPLASATEHPQAAARSGERKGSGEW